MKEFQKRTYERRPLGLFGLLAVLLVSSSLLPLARATARHGWAHPEARRTNGEDPLRDRQWGLRLIQAPEAWEIADGSGAIIAVVDTGIDANHPDLRRNILSSQGINVLQMEPADGFDDDYGHGTLVAGIAAAVTGNGFGIAGVAPRARLLPIKVCRQDGTCPENAVARGIRHAARRGAQVINLSLGFGYVTSRTDMGEGAVDRAVRSAWEQGSLIVAGAGNEGLPICREPAATPRATVLCVGSVSENDLPAFYSNWDLALQTLYLMAPGGSGTQVVLDVEIDCDNGILSTFPTSLQPSSCSAALGFDVASGTSMAAPFVSGVAALLASQGLTNQEIVETILSTTDDLGPPGRDPRFGFGRVNALRAVTQASNG